GCAGLGRADREVLPARAHRPRLRRVLLARRGEQRVVAERPVVARGLDGDRAVRRHPPLPRRARRAGRRDRPQPAAPLRPRLTLPLAAAAKDRSPPRQDGDEGPMPGATHLPEDRPALPRQIHKEVRMTTIEETPLDPAKLEQFVFRAVDEVGATLNAALVVMGDRLGLSRAMAGAGELTAAELAARTATAERYVREWLNAQAAGGFVAYNAATGGYSLPPEQAVALTDPDSPAYLPGLFETAIGSVLDSPRITDAVRSGEGVGWHEHNHHVFDGCERFFRPGYNANLVGAWLPALDGVIEALERGARVADVGCGHGASTILMAQAFPNSTF